MEEAKGALIIQTFWSLAVPSRLKNLLFMDKELVEKLKEAAGDATVVLAEPGKAVGFSQVFLLIKSVNCQVTPRQAAEIFATRMKEATDGIYGDKVSYLSE